MLRKISSPGIEINEIDRSQYDSMPNYSIVGTTCLICGFSDKGPNYAIRWMNTVQTLIDTYGYPTTEEEKYFFNACYEILQKGGLCLAAKLPYDNPSLSTLPYVEYEIEPPTFDVLSNTCLSNVSQFDDTLMSCAYIRIKQNTNKTFSGYISAETHTAQTSREFQRTLYEQLELRTASTRSTRYHFLTTKEMETLEYEQNLLNAWEQFLCL